MTKHIPLGSTLFLLVLVLVPPKTASATMLAAYDFENGNTALTSVDSDPFSLASAVAGPEINIRHIADRGEKNVPAFVPGTNDQSLVFNAFSADTSSAAAARANNHYFSFTLSAVGRNALDLENLTFRTALSNVVLSRTWTLDYSLDGGAFVNDFDSGAFSGPQTTSTNSPVWTAFNVDLSGAEFDRLSSITLRFVQHGASNSTHAVLFDKIALHGDPIPLPEPSSWLLLAGVLGLIGLVAKGRRAAADA